MTKEEKIKLLKYFYPNEEIQNFMCNDFFVELKQVLPLNICISSKNQVNKTRQENLKLAQTLIKDFLKANPVYTKTLKEFFDNIDIDYILESYVFYLSNTNNKEVDIYKDKNSICYSKISIIL